MKQRLPAIVLAALCLNFPVKAQQPNQPTSIKSTTSGKVISASSQEPLPGAIIKITNTNDQTRSNQTLVTNERGEFTLTLPDGNYNLSVHYLSYKAKTLTIQIPLTQPLIISLDTDEQTLQEVEINAGYYTVKDRERTGSISRVSSETIGKQPVNNPLMALQGRLSGVQIIQQNGLPGAGFTVQVRGRNSINSGNAPLYIIDGVNYPSGRISGSGQNLILGATTGANSLSLINPNDIESIEVLKDADATSIYGSMGANGVVLITTKRGAAGETKINAALSQGFSKVGRRLDLLNTQEYLEMRREAFKNDGLQPGATDYDLNGTYDQNKFTDWQSVLIGNTANLTNALLSLSGGTTKSNYLVSGDYYQEGTVFPGDFGFKRINFKSSINLGNATDRLNASFTANYNHTQSNLLTQDLTSAILLPPNLPDPYDEYGNLTWANNTISPNPMALLPRSNNAGTNAIIGNLILSYKLLKNLTVKTSIGYSSIKRDEFQKNPLATSNPASGLTAANRTSSFSDNYNNTLMAEPTITYQAAAGKGRFNLLTGMSFQDNAAQLRTINASGFNSDDLLGNIASAATLTSSNNYTQYRYLAIFARLNYVLSEKYFLNLTGRRDGSTRFGEDKQYANFGAVGAAWIFSEETFIKDRLRFLNFGKLRGSYGTTGNDQIPNYGYLQLWNTNGTYQGVSTLTPGGTAPNADFAWEINRKLEFAMQLGFLNNKVNLEIAHYINRSSNQLLSASLPLSTGLGSVLRNLPATVQNNGWEFDAKFRFKNSQKIQWSTAINFTIPKNKLLSYPGLETSADAIDYQVGQPLSILKVYNSWVDSQTGLYVIEDKNGNSLVDNADRYLTKFVGQYWYGGIQNSFRYKQFGLDFQFSFTKQNDMSYRSLISRTPGGWLSASTLPNQPSEVMNRWQHPGDETMVQKFSTLSSTNTLNTNVKNFGNLAVTDASFIKLRNVSLTYELLPKLLSTLKMRSAIISLQGQNLLTFTNYIGLDPETAGSLRVPPLRTVAMAVSVTF